MLIYSSLSVISEVEASGSFNLFGFKVFCCTELLYDSLMILNVYTPKWPEGRNSWVSNSHVEIDNFINNLIDDSECEESEQETSCDGKLLFF